MSKYMLDTNICIYLIKNKPETVYTNIQKHNFEDMCISSITYAELCYGVEKSNYVERNRVALTLMMSRLKIVDFDTKASECYGKIRSDLEKKGTPIGPLDMLIAAHAKSLDCIVVTNNEKEFKKVSNIMVENWTNK